MLSSNAVSRMITALGDSSSPEVANAGNEVVTAINNGNAAAVAAGFYIPVAIVAAHISSTTDFAALVVGDYVVHTPATAGNSAFFTVATAGTLPAAAVVGDLYVVIRQSALPAASAVAL